MTTVVVTKTHIGSDQARMTMDTNTDIIVDPDHKKIFISEDETFIVALEGIYDPHWIQKPETMDWFKALFDKASLAFNRGMAKLTDPEDLKMYDSLFIEKVKFIVVTTRDRILFKHEENKDIFNPEKSGYRITAVRAADNAVLGSGGKYAQGLLLGGISIFDIWSRVAAYDDWTSKEYTVVDLSILKESV